MPTKELEPEPYHEPEPVYYSEEEREPMPRRMQTPPPMPFSSWSSYVAESSSESDSSYDEEEAILPCAPEPERTQSAAFDVVEVPDFQFYIRGFV